MKVKLSNIPIPEVHVIAIFFSVLIRLFFPLKIFKLNWIGHLLGWPMVVFGIWIAVWAALEAGEVNLSAPDKLITTGPYAFSRNPMYLGWTLLYLGLIFVIKVIYSLGLLVIFFVYLHFF